MGALILAAGCSPNQAVKPGAPVLSKFTILEGGATATDITADAADCPSGSAEGSNCVAMDTMVEAGTIPMSPVCKLTDTFCHCVAKDAADQSIDPNDPMTSGSYVCTYAPMSAVIAIFDRLLDGAPFEPTGDAAVAPVSNVASLTATPAPTATVGTLTDYTSNGSSTGIVFPLLGPLFFSNYRVFGPSLLVAGDPAFPSASTVAVALDKTKVRAKDGKTPFTSSGLIQDGTISFHTGPFTAAITVPMPPMATDDASPPPTTVPPDNAAVTIAFNNAVDTATLATAISITANGAPFTAFMVDSSMAPTVTITPNTTWTPSTTFVVTVGATAKDATGVAISAPVMSDSFTTSAM